MENWRTNPFSEIVGEKVIRLEDYATQEATDLLTNKKEKLDIPASNVLIYYTDQGSKIAARPSGTEPKIKFYVSVNVPADSESPEKLLNQKIEAIVQFLDVDKA